MSASRDDHDIYSERLPLRKYPAEVEFHPDEHTRANLDGRTASPLLDNSQERDSKSTKHVVPSVSPAPDGHDRRGWRSKPKLPPSFVQVFWPGLVRCVISWCLIVGFYVSLWVYKDRVISPGTKSVFDAITVALSIAFGLNIASSLKEIALSLRWWVLDKKRRPAREVELILHCDSMTDLLHLMWSVPRLGTIGACLVWLSINMLAQTGIASLGLTYSAIPGREDIYRASVMSNVSIPDLSHFTPDTGRSVDDIFVERFAAHVLGDIGSSYQPSPLPESDLDETPWASNPAAFWNATDHWEYVSLDSAPSNVSNSPGFLSIYTNRTVRSSAVCITPAYRLDRGTDVATFQLDSGEVVLFPENALNGEGTYYLTALDSAAICGQGCGNVKVVETASGPPAPGSFVGDPGIFYYDCNITLASSPEFTTGVLPPDQAVLAARAIALSGQIPEPGLGNSNFVFYNLGVTFGEAQNNSVTGMASLLSRFAIGVIAAAAQTNQPKIVLGHPPTQGVRLHLDSPATFDLILGLVAGTQVILVLVAAILCGRLVIPEDVLLSHEEEIRKRFVLDS